MSSPPTMSFTAIDQQASGITDAKDKDEDQECTVDMDLETPSSTAVNAAATSTATATRKETGSKSSSSSTLPSMDDWFQQATPEECDAMSALQLEYRFQGDTMSMWWQVFQQVGFTYSSSQTYLPPSRQQEAGRAAKATNNKENKHNNDYSHSNNSDDGQCSNQEGDNFTRNSNEVAAAAASENSFTSATPSGGFQCNDLFYFLDLLAIPELVSTLQDFPVIPDELLKLSSEEQIWWRRLRDELLFRKFHHSLEPSDLGGRSTRETNTNTTTTTTTTLANSRSPRNHAEKNDSGDVVNGTKRKQMAGSTAVASSSQRTTRQRTVTSSDRGAELVMRRPTGKTKDKKRGLTKGVDKEMDDDDNDDEPMVFPTIQDYATQARTYQLSDVQAIEASHARNDFYEWRFLLTTNHSLLLYGLGSKRFLMNQFADQELSQSNKRGGDLLVLDGFDKDITVEGILDLIVDQWLDGISPEYSLYNVETAVSATLGRSKSSPPPQRTSLLARVGITFPHQGGRHVVQRAIAIARALAERASRTRQPLYLVIHTMDGVGLRNPSAQEALAALVFNSTLDSNGMNAVRLVASVDHVNAPTVLWNSWTRASFRWIWKAVHTYRPYIEETTRSTFVDTRRKNGTSVSTKRASGGSKRTSGETGTRRNDEDDDDDEANIFYILASLAPRHTEVLQRLSELQLTAYDEAQRTQAQDLPGGGVLEEEDICVDYIDLMRECQLQCIVTADQQLRGYLKELCDQEIVEKRQMGSSVRLLYRIPYSKSKLKEILKYKR